jgi:beta-glucosidase
MKTTMSRGSRLLLALVVVLAVLAVGLAVKEVHPTAFRSVASSADVEIKTPYDRAVEMLAQMTLDEKLAMMHGHPGIYVGNVMGNKRLGIPSINMQDGPQVENVSVTFPKKCSLIALCVVVRSLWCRVSE